MLSRLGIAFLSRRKRLLISWLQSPSAVILEPKEIKSVTVYIISPSIYHGVTLMLGKIEGRRRRGQQHHQLNEHEFEQTPGDSGGQRSLPGYSPWDHRVRHDLVTEQQTHGRDLGKLSNLAALLKLST